MMSPAQTGSRTASLGGFVGAVQQLQSNLDEHPLDYAWGPIERMIGLGGVQKVTAGKVGKFSAEAREEAARKLIGNHKNLIKDICNPRPTLNIDGRELTQNELRRVSPALSQYVDEGLREAARLLIGRGQPTVLHSSPEAMEARAACARYLDFRIQSTPQQRPGREPDMSEQAAAAFKAALVKVGFTAWEPLHNLLSEGVAEAPETSGVAARHSTAARLEAAETVLGNHFNLLQDICNPRPGLNIIAIPLTQTELVRVSPQHAGHVDEGLREAVRRLIGRGQPVMLNHSPEAEEARAACARYLDFRIQSKPDQKPGRTPDMSEEAAAALKAVLVEVGFSSWEPIYKMIGMGASADVSGAAMGHKKAARLEAAQKVVGNHFNLLQDICNPRPNLNIIAVPLTQTELVRVNPQHAAHVDAQLREAVRRLLGRGEIGKLSQDPAAFEARAACAKYLDTRIQSKPAQKPGRKPDMSEPAAAAFKAVLVELAGGGVDLAWCDPAGVKALALAKGLEDLAAQIKSSGEITAHQAELFSGALTEVAGAAAGERQRPSVMQRRPSQSRIAPPSAPTTPPPSASKSSKACAIM